MGGQGRLPGGRNISAESSCGRWKKIPVDGRGGRGFQTRETHSRTSKEEGQSREEHFVCRRQLRRWHRTGLVLLAEDIGEELIFFPEGHREP